MERPVWTLQDGKYCFVIYFCDCILIWTFLICLSFLQPPPHTLLSNPSSSWVRVRQRNRSSCLCSVLQMWVLGSQLELCGFTTKVSAIVWWHCVVLYGVLYVALWWVYIAPEKFSHRSFTQKCLTLEFQKKKKKNTAEVRRSSFFLFPLETLSVDLLFQIFSFLWMGGWFHRVPLPHTEAVISSVFSTMI